MSEQTNNPDLPVPQLKKIDIEKGVFRSCGVNYYIDTEAMGYERTVRFAEMIPVISYGRRYIQLVEFIHAMRVKMTSGGDDFKKTYFDVATELTNFDQYLLDNAGEYADKYIDDVLRFCALFCVTKDEDLTTINDRLIEDKIENWKKDMDMSSFFLLAKLRVPGYRETLMAIQGIYADQGKNQDTNIRRT